MNTARGTTTDWDAERVSLSRHFLRDMEQLWSEILRMAGVVEVGLNTAVRATGIGLTYNSGRILTAVGILYFGSLMKHFNDDFARVGSISSWVYFFGVVMILFAPRTIKKS